MNRIPVYILLLFLLIFLPGNVRSQPSIGAWRDHFSYNHAVGVVETPDKIYCNTRGGLFYLNLHDESLHTLSKVNGLHDHGISVMRYAAEQDILILAYDNTNIDLVSNDEITNINDIYRKSITGTKQINAVTVIGSYAYLSTSFGVVVLNLIKKEIKDTYYLSENGEPLSIHDFIQFGSYFYTSTVRGVFRAPTDSPDLVYYGAWERVTNIPSSNKSYNHLLAINNLLLIERSDDSMLQDSLLLYNENSWSLFLSEPGLKISAMGISQDHLLISSETTLRIYNLQLTQEHFIDDIYVTSPHIKDALIDANGTLYIANLEGGLITSSDFSTFNSIYPNGPYTNDAFSVTAWQGYVAIAGGGRDAIWNNIFRYGLIYYFHEGMWHSMIETNIRDIVQVIPNPGNPTHMYAATWGYGILEMVNNTFVKTWNEENSTLQSIIPGSPFVRIGGMAFDKQDRLWVTNSGVTNTISVKTGDNSWTGIPYGPYINAPTIGNILITNTGKKWVQLPRGYGLFIFDDHDTPGDINDDDYKKINVVDQDGQSHNDVYCIAEDHSGFVWVGTSQGPVVYYDPEEVFSTEGMTAQRILIPRNDGSGLADYLLSTQQINTIVVDGADRKWIGTEKAGAFLLAPDGTEKILHFTTENSPLPSDLVYSIAIEPDNGEVYFATDKGVISYRGTATQSKEDLNSVYVFPNPIRPDWHGNVTITGLSEDIRIKITDISGNLVFETHALGGQAFWNLKNTDGREVNSGIYLVFITDSQGTQTMTTKILVIR